MTRSVVSERIALSFDGIPTDDKSRLEMLARTAKEVGIGHLSMGGGLGNAEGWLYCSRLAGRYSQPWMADAKIHDTPEKVAQTMRTLKFLWTPPEAVTVHLASGEEAVRAAREVAGDEVRVLGVTVLNSVKQDEAFASYGGPLDAVINRMARMAVATDLDGVVVPPQYVEAIKRDPETASLFTVVDTTSGMALEDSVEVLATPAASALGDGADLVVVGGGTLSPSVDPSLMYRQLVQRVEGALDR